ncbi:hypothetical protein B566_EDAN001966 [Ephemera danica]|nr:hypothetical protein B566_EDAN001966 [Ephemera danica]
MARELDRHLAAVGDAAARRGDQGPTPSASAAHAAATVRGRNTKRPAPTPPVVLRSCVTSATSNPDLSHVHRHSPTSSPRHKLRKSISMSGSRGFLNIVLSALRGGSSTRYRLTGAPSPLHTRRSKSHDYLDLAPLDQEQRMATDAARSAQMRRGTVAHCELRKTGHVRSLSEEPRLLLPFHARAARRDSGGHKSPRRPDNLMLPSPGRSRYYPREPSPLTRRPRTPYELVVVPPTPDLTYSVPGVSDEALYEIRAFEQLIERFFKQQAASKKVRNSLF